MHITVSNRHATNYICVFLVLITYFTTTFTHRHTQSGFSARAATKVTRWNFININCVQFFIYIIDLMRFIFSFVLPLITIPVIFKLQSANLVSMRYLFLRFVIFYDFSSHRIVRSDFHNIHRNIWCLFRWIPTSFNCSAVFDYLQNIIFFFKFAKHFLISIDINDFMVFWFVSRII